MYYANTKADAAEAGFDDGFIYGVIVKSLLQRSVPIINFPKANATNAFKQWL